MKHYFLFAMLLLGMTYTLSACATTREYSAEPIEAWVVDAETGQPLEGVIVVAHWKLEGTGLYWDTEKWELAGSIHQGHTVGALQVFEAVTDHNGRFFFPAWGPLKARNGILTDSDPALLLFKGGYEYKPLSNSLGTGGIDRERVRSTRRWSNWNGKTIELMPFQMALAARREERRRNPLALDRSNPFPGTAEEEYANHLAFLKTSLEFAYNGNNCEWKQVPHMLVAQHLEKKRFEKNRIFNTLQSIDSVAGQKKCGSAQDFFRGYIP
jgi:hypothetical protein